VLRFGAHLIGSELNVGVRIRVIRYITYPLIYFGIFEWYDFLKHFYGARKNSLYKKTVTLYNIFFTLETNVNTRLQTNPRIDNSLVCHSCLILKKGNFEVFFTVNGKRFNITEHSNQRIRLSDGF
jgi:hypothetical protein